MHRPQDIAIASYTYQLPTDRIASMPLPQRDAAKLLVYKEGALSNSKFSLLADHIPKDSLLVFNKTKVVHARLLFTKASGGSIELFCLAPAVTQEIASALQQKASVKWQCLIGGKAKWKNQEVLQLKHQSLILEARLEDAANDVVLFSWNEAQLTFAEVLHLCGKVPLPPYIKRAAEQADEHRYQTLFAQQEGSVAAPTASLHFSDEVLQTLAAKNVVCAYATLHVGAGTFMPVKSEAMGAHEMHEEWIAWDAAFIQQLLAHNGSSIIATGTTTLRMLESLYWIGLQLHHGIVPDWQGVAVNQWYAYECTLPKINPQEALHAIAKYMLQHNLSTISTRTQILIAPGYECTMARALITNFHQPQSTLLLLVAAFIGESWRTVYEFALNNEYRFLSYGDTSLLWRKCK